MGLSADDFRRLARQETKAADAHDILLEYARGIGNAKKIAHHEWAAIAHRGNAIALYDAAADREPPPTGLTTWSPAVIAAYERDRLRY